VAARGCAAHAHAGRLTCRRKPSCSPSASRCGWSHNSSANCAASRSAAGRASSSQATTAAGLDPREPDLPLGKEAALSTTLAGSLVPAIT
jgi:hypothetical protein